MRRQGLDTALEQIRHSLNSYEDSREYWERLLAYADYDPFLIGYIDSAVPGFQDWAMMEQVMWDYFHEGRIENPPSSGEAAIVSKTSRCSPAIGANAVTPRYVIQLEKKNQKILDYGAGHCAMQTLTLKSNGFRHVTAWDVQENQQTTHHDPNALSQKYDVVMASNVLNVQINKAMLRRTLKEVASLLKKKGRFYANYPKSPRKTGLTEKELLNELKQWFTVKTLQPSSKGLVIRGVLK